MGERIYQKQTYVQMGLKVRRKKSFSGYTRGGKLEKKARLEKPKSFFESVRGNTL